MVIDGRKIADQILGELKKRPVPQKFLAAVLVGNDPASTSFVKQKERVAKELGVDFRIQKLEINSAESALIDTLKRLGEDKECGGTVLQLPLPVHLDRDRVIATIPPEKDVDALHGNLVSPPAVGVVEEILKTNNYQLKTSIVVVIGMGFLVGRPIAKWLEGKTKELIALDIGDDFARLKEADVVIMGVGKAGLVKPEMLKNGALVIDFGCSRGDDGKLHGDFDASQIENWKLEIENLRYTPVPHGTGPILVAKLFENFYVLNP